MNDLDESGRGLIKVLSQQNHKNAGIPAESRTEHLQNMYEGYRYAHLLGECVS
jgi:hypothetical protein